MGFMLVFIWASGLVDDDESGVLERHDDETDFFDHWYRFRDGLSLSTDLFLEESFGDCLKDVDNSMEVVSGSVLR